MNIYKHTAKPSHVFSLDVGEAKSNRNQIKICDKLEETSN